MNKDEKLKDSKTSYLTYGRTFSNHVPYFKFEFFLKKTKKLFKSSDKTLNLKIIKVGKNIFFRRIGNIFLIHLSATRFGNILKSLGHVYEGLFSILKNLTYFGKMSSVIGQTFILVTGQIFKN